MTNVEYYHRFWTARYELEQFKVKQPLNEVIKCELVEPSSHLRSVIQGRQQDEKFLHALEMLVEVVREVESFVFFACNQEGAVEILTDWEKRNEQLDETYRRAVSIMTNNLTDDRFVSLSEKL